jgi:hypothetical protein
VILPPEINIADWELIEDGKPYRQMVRAGAGDRALGRYPLTP